jgi:hypothetical protein
MFVLSTGQVDNFSGEKHHICRSISLPSSFKNTNPIAKTTMHMLYIFYGEPAKDRQTKRPNKNPLFT